MHPHLPRHVLTVDDVATAILATPGIEGVTYSGGEPFEQVEPLVVLSLRLRQAGLSVVSYTGYTLEELRRSGRPPMQQLLDCLDVVIDGPFVRDQASCLLWRGSRNQRIWFLTDRYRDWAARVETSPAQVQMSFQGGHMMTTGTWPDGLVEELEQALQQPELV